MPKLPTTPKKTNKCKDCGYLALVHFEKSPPVPIKPDFFPSKEVEFQRRQPEFWMPTYWPIRCHVQKANLDEELRTHYFGGSLAVSDNMTLGEELKDFGHGRMSLIRKGSAKDSPHTCRVFHLTNTKRKSDDSWRNAKLTSKQ